ncbi:glucosaminidase domain-containing protein [Puia dinghuensis]|uniref:Peptidoglycan hydrolase n=1 Tax=Puia dinghuensis TaxID=1792502 RepID=A0A8J2UH22_9BACT|nr:glucosaminidase domain-containing protein [Puia dinghuensis]GGB16405.1 N-acetylmuramoyl-L-alanine amidase [Puia dinghuensis]
MPIKNIAAGLLLMVAVKQLPAQMSVNGVIYVNTYKEIAMAEMQRSGIPAAIILAQGLHESEAGTSELVKQSNNHFGIKCKDDWKGPVVYHDDDARQECFRSYATAADSYRDHSDFLRRGTRYAFLFQLDPTDYEGWSYGLRKAGYATNIRYSQILIKLIKDYNLQQYTLIAMGKMKPSEEVVLTMPGAPIVKPVEVAAGGTASGGGTVSTGGGGLGRAAGGAGTEVTDVAYPEGEFAINRTKVVYVQAGTSLLAVANRYDLSLPRLLEFNDMREQDVLVKGQLIFLQRKRRTGSIEIHVVRDGESVYDICQAEGIRLQDLLELNQLSSDSKPVAGERIYLQRSAPSRPRLVTDSQR